MSVTINGTNGLTFNDNTTQATSPFAGGLGFRNRIINGDMRIDQRNNGAVVTLAAGGGSVSGYPVDRWMVFKGNNGGLTAQRSSVAPSGFLNSLLITVTTTMTGATDFAAIRQNIEGFNVADLGWGTASAQSVAVGFWVRCSITGTFNCSFLNSAENRAYVASFTINSANTWEFKTVAIPGDTGGTWLTDNSTGLRFLIDLGTGSTYSITAGSWQAFNFGYGLTGGTKLMANAGATLYITGVQLEKGSTATSFDYRPYGTELALCYRYTAPVDSMAGFVNTGSTTSVVGSIQFPVPMRASPSLALTAVAKVSDTVADFTQSSASISIIASRVTPNAANVSLTNFTGLTALRPVYFITGAATIMCYAEL